MSDSSDSLRIVFNGEIYNYRELREELRQKGQTFRTASDTEVILSSYQLWGDDFIKRLNGMFAFAMYDERQRRLLLARDRAGEKPLYYYYADGEISFASELKALMADPAVPRVVDPSALEFYLAYGYVPNEMCMLKGVKKLPAAHMLEYDLKTCSLRTWRYWALPDPVTSVEESSEELVAELEALLKDSVKRQLVADVPIGILLSGGIDSSLVTAMAAQVSSQPVRTFTISFPGHSAFDEGPHARLVADHFGTRHTELVAVPATVELLPRLARQYDEPMADSSMVPTFMVSELIRKHATVALGGDGGDELFGGYQHYSWILQQETVRSVIPSPFRRVAHRLIRDHVPRGVKGRNYLLGFTAELSESLARYGLFFDASTRRRLLRRGSSNGVPTPESVRSEMFADGRSPIQRATAVDFSTYMTDDILVKVDRASMLASLEVRAPFLDYRIIEFAFGRLPDSLRTTRKNRKIILRMLARRILPATFDVRRKQGFSLPLASWFKGSWGDYFEEILLGQDNAIFEQREISSLLLAQRRGLANTNRLFALVMFELWRREYGIRVS